MKQIWRYEIPKTDDSDFSIDMPFGSCVLCVQLKNGRPNIWAEVNPEEEGKKPKTFKLFGTGHNIPDDFKGRYIGTFQIDVGGIFGILVWHLYEKEK